MLQNFMTYHSTMHLTFFSFMLVLLFSCQATAQIKVNSVDTTMESEIEKTVKAYRDGTPAEEAIQNLADFTFELFVKDGKAAYEKWKDTTPKRRKKGSQSASISFSDDNKFVDYSLYYNYFNLIVSLAVQEYRLGNNQYDIEKETDKDVIKKIASGWFWSHLSSTGHVR
ncbi:MAG: hypothetical protein JJT94_11500 [Bernardetiaceae bacterium]|nr:hypothetical protein [Bernardetiaceae bacterium]